jgi:hypothetical protein
MVYADIEYLADTMLMEAFLSDGPITKLAQTSFASSIAQEIKDYVLSKFDKNHPISSIMTFLGGGLIWRISPMMGIFYEVAAALGFDWQGFWQAVGKNLEDFLSTIFSSGQKPSEQFLSSQVDTAVDSAAREHFQDKPNRGMIEALRRRFAFKDELKNIIELKAIITKEHNDKVIVKNAAAITAKLMRFFIRAIKWVVKTALISLGLTAGAGAISGLLGHHPGAGVGEGRVEETEGGAPPMGIVSIPVSQSVSPELTEWHQNDMRSAWIEHGEIGTVPNLVMQWIMNAYPQLENYESEISNSSSFRSVLSRFMSRNRLAQGLGIFSIPRPYQRKLDVVNQIVSGFLQEHPDAARQPSQQSGRGTFIDYK